MAYCKEFTDLFKEDALMLQNPLFKAVDINQSTVAAQLNNLDCNTIHPWLDNLYETFDKNKVHVRPFHLGLGNPNADILIVGKELAIEVNKSNPPQLSLTNCTINDYYKKLFVNEAILNYFLWACKVNGVNIPPNCCIQDPEFASSFCQLYNLEKPGGHYWAKVNRVISLIQGKNIVNNEIFRTQGYNDSFFKEVFLTELHDIPSAQSPANPNAPAIQLKLNDLATIPFYRKFKRIIFACKNYLNKNLPDYQKAISETYNTKLTHSKVTRNIKDVFEAGEQRIIICNNLSGTAGWSNEELQTLGTLLK